MSAIDQAFAERPDLQKRIYEAIAKQPELERLFYDISTYVCPLKSSSDTDENNQASKKRKLNDNGETKQETKQESRHGNGVNNGHWEKGTYSEIKEISFSIPQRKKLTLEIGKLPNQGLRASNPSTGGTEFQVQWSDVEHVVCLPVPEKAQVSHNFCVFTNSVAEQVLWTVPGNVPKAGIVGNEIHAEPDETFKDILIRLLNQCLKSRKARVIVPDEKEFVSQTAQASRKGEKAVHVKAFRGSKDGYLFFLPTGIVWGFKKPLEFFAFDSIDSVSYTSVLQRTFNLVITITTSISTEEFEFSMLDQADFAGIDAYIKRHQLQDASMAEQRRAKKLNINGVKGEKGEDANSEAEEGDLQKAAREAEDLEDEDEEEDENFDPGSEGESEGSGSSDEEEEAGDGDAGGDLVQGELGSEAEEVEAEEMDG